MKWCCPCRYMVIELPFKPLMLAPCCYEPYFALPHRPSETNEP